MLYFILDGGGGAVLIIKSIFFFNRTSFIKRRGNLINITKMYYCILFSFIRFTESESFGSETSSEAGL